jgi:hypothetical protein
MLGTETKPATDTEVMFLLCVFWRIDFSNTDVVVGRKQTAGGCQCSETGDLKEAHSNALRPG